MATRRCQPRGGVSEVSRGGLTIGSVNLRERIDAFWSGERPDQIPYTIYQNEWRHTADDPAWVPMYANGLGVTWYLRSFEWKLRGVETADEPYVENGKPMRRLTSARRSAKSTPRGPMAGIKSTSSKRPQTTAC